MFFSATLSSDGETVFISLDQIIYVKILSKQTLLLKLSDSSDIKIVGDEEWIMQILSYPDSTGVVIGDSEMENIKRSAVKQLRLKKVAMKKELPFTEEELNS